MSTAMEPGEDEAHLSPQEKMISRLIIKCQDEMFHRLEKSQDKMFCRLEDMLRNVLVQPPHTKLETERNSCGSSCAGYDTDHVKSNPLYQSDELKLKEPMLNSATLTKDDDENAKVSEQYDQQILESGQFEAAQSGDWAEALKFFENNPPEEMTNENRIIGLRIAVLNNQLEFVKKFVELLPPAALAHKIKDSGFTALHTAAAYGYTEIAQVLVEKNPDVTQTRDKKGRVPLQLSIQAVTVGQKKTVEYLYSVTRDSPFSGNDGAKLLCSSIDANFYDIALKIIQKFPDLLTRKQLIPDNNDPSKPKAKVHNPCALGTMIQRPLAFPSGAKLTWLERKLYSLTSADIDSACNHDVQADEQNVSRNQYLSPPCLSKGWKCKCNWYPFQSKIEAVNGTYGDEENPQRSSKVNQIGGNNPLQSLAVYCMHGIARVLPIQQSIYKQKLMHTQALALIKQMFNQLGDTMDKPEALEFLKKNANMIKKAIKHGTIEIVEVCLEKFPYLIWHDLGGQTMIQMAVAERNEKILDLICKFSGTEKMDLVSRKDPSGNTLLHHAAQLAPPDQLNSVCGSALQLQRELKWFKGVESLLQAADKVRRNKEGHTAQYIFTEKHRVLVVEGGEWMKNISEACMVVAALIATVAFAAVFTAPGGYISDSSSPMNGTPVFLGTKSFTVFALADALALFSSITSVLMFLAIYTSRHAEEDFYKSLPQKLIIGLTTLFVSMATILVSFGASLFIMLRHRFAWTPYPIMVFSFVPLALFVWLQLPLFVEMVRSTYCHSLFREHRHIRPTKQKNE